MIISELWDAFYRLRNRLKLEPIHGLQPRLYEVIQPITSIDDLLREGKALQEAVSITGDGSFQFGLCPEGKRRRVLGIFLAVSSGTYLITGFNLGDVSQDISFNFQSQTAATTLKNTTFNPFYMEPGDYLQATISTHSVNGNLQCNVLCEEEDAF